MSRTMYPTHYEVRSSTSLLETGTKEDMIRWAKAHVPEKPMVIKVVAADRFLAKIEGLAWTNEG